jgi:hypothetical protein
MLIGGGQWALWASQVARAVREDGRKKEYGEEKIVAVGVIIG